ncbi:MAG: cadherin-like beta sandwich domain-containing protein [Firmicutes bacterium]|nr:cadherin-like beta sandwich domain-containing protein [Bacillota bacterium]
MKKKLSVLLIFVMVFTLVLSSATVAFGASASLSVSGGGSYTKGSTVNVKFTYSGSSIGGGTASVRYDSSVLQYVSCSGGIAPNSASGVFSVQMGDGNDHSSITVSLTFKAIGSGSTSVSVSTSDLIDYDGNTLNFPSSSTTVTVTNPAPSVSSNANLSSLYASAGSLSPAFSPGRTSYTVYADEDETVCLIDAETEDPDATIDVAGSKNLIIGRNVRSVIVTAPNGSTKTYTITIYRGEESSSGEETPDPNEDEDGEKPEQEKPKEDIKVEIGDITYVIEENIKSEDVPDEFRLVVGKYDGKDIPLIKDNNLKYTMALLINQESGDYKWFFYDEEAGTFSETKTFATDEVMDYVKLSANGTGEDGNEVDNNLIMLLAAFGGTLLILILIVLVLQVKILKNRKKKAPKRGKRTAAEIEALESVEDEEVVETDKN